MNLNHNINRNGTPKHISECLPKYFDSAAVRQILEQPFEEHQIKYRPGSFGKTLAYIEGHEVIKRLNLAFQGKWSFEIVAHEIKDTEVLVVGKLICPDANIIKMAFGGSKVTVNTDTGEEISIVDDLKAAATDALKKAASLLGVGLHLYESSNERKRGCTDAPQCAGSGKGNNGDREGGDGNGGGNGNGNSRLTARQLAAIYAIAKSKGMNKDDVQRMSVNSFDRMPDFLSISQASNMIQSLQSA